jgi:hypothetical protein
MATSERVNDGAPNFDRSGMMQLSGEAEFGSAGTRKDPIQMRLEIRRETTAAVAFEKAIAA